jgi:hypothetical protein
MNIVFKVSSELSPDEVIRHAEVLAYVQDFLTSAHPARKGHVCPFVRKAITDGTLYFGIIKEMVAADIAQIAKAAITKQKSNRDRNKGLGAVVMLFEQHVDIAVLRRVHKKLMLKAMGSGLMIGVFGPNDDTASFYEPDFYPFRAPVNLLVVRDMVSHDLKFFKESGIRNRSRRMQIYRSYIETFQNSALPSHIDGVKAAQNELKLDAMKPFWHFW